MSTIFPDHSKSNSIKPTLLLTASKFHSHSTDDFSRRSSNIFESRTRRYVLISVIKPSKNKVKKIVK